MVASEYDLNIELMACDNSALLDLSTQHVSLLSSFPKHSPQLAPMPRLANGDGNGAQTTESHPALRVAVPADQGSPYHQGLRIELLRFVIAQIKVTRANTTRNIQAL